MAIPLAYNVRNLFVRRWTTAFTMGGIALVVAVTMLLAGRVFQPNLGQVVIGAGAVARYAPGGIGSDLGFGRRRWRVVGIFDSGGTAFDSEIWADVADVQDDTRRDGYSGVRLRLAPGAD